MLGMLGMLRVSENEEKRDEEEHTGEVTSIIDMYRGLVSRRATTSEFL